MEDVGRLIVDSENDFYCGKGDGGARRRSLAAALARGVSNERATSDIA